AIEFRNRYAIPLMRAKNELDDYFEGTHFLSGNRLFEVTPTLDLQPVDDGVIRDSLKKHLTSFRQLNRYLTSGEHIYPQTETEKSARKQRTADDSLVAQLNLSGSTPEDQLRLARVRAEAKDYETARAILRRLLRRTPSYHDARALLGRSYAW